MEHKVHIGDSITALGLTFKIAKIIYQDWWERFGYDIEFLDENGSYHHWKQWDDGGTVNREHRLIDWYGTDVTDLFEKYGYRRKNR